MIFNHKIILDNNIRILPDLVHLRFSGKNISANARPGNFVQIKVSDGLDPTFRRPMSIHNCNGDNFEMVFRTVGKGTNILANAKPGQVFDIIGPLGNTFELPKKDEIAVMISGGIGFPPLHFFTKTLLEKYDFPSENILFLLGMKNNSEKPMTEDVLKLNVPTEISTDDGSEGFCGLVTELFENIYSKLLRNKKVKLYACGPTPMLKTVARIALGFKLFCQLSLEGNMPCGIGTCLGCAVKMRGHDDYYRVCKEGPVFESKMIEL